MFKVLKQTNITVYLAEIVANSLFVCDPITNGELTELITGIRPETQPGYILKTALMDSTSRSVVCVMTDIDGAKSTLSCKFFLSCLLLKDSLSKKITIELILAQLSIVFLNELSNGYNFELVNGYTAKGEEIVNSFGCGILG
tara:strand:+ start:355 stop:780 length:426 start_codon:yes stop_codon:yes gene_type:complete